MSKPTYRVDLADLDIDPKQIFRPSEAEKILGYKHTQRAELVRSGELEAPFLLSADGKAVGWTGAQLIRFHRKRIAATIKKLEAENATIEKSESKTATIEKLAQDHDVTS